MRTYYFYFKDGLLPRKTEVDCDEIEFRDGFVLCIRSKEIIAAYASKLLKGLDSVLIK